jgi:hypothetical protein
MKAKTISALNGTVWLDGFENTLTLGHSSSDHDNPYFKTEEPAYSQYKAGAKAAELFSKTQNQKP